MTAPAQILVMLARQSASSWGAMAAETFRGEASFETANTVYRFRDGVFVSSARKPTRSLEAPAALRGVRLIGFLAYEQGLWSLSPRFRQGALAVMWRPGGHDERSFILTSPASGFTLEAPPRELQRQRVSDSGVVRRMTSRPPTLRRPAPPSMTRILADAGGAAGDHR